MLLISVHFPNNKKCVTLFYTILLTMGKGLVGLASATENVDVPQFAHGEVNAHVRVSFQVHWLELLEFVA